MKGELTREIIANLNSVPGRALEHDLRARLCGSFFKSVAILSKSGVTAYFRKTRAAPMESTFQPSRCAPAVTHRRVSWIDL